MLISRAGVLFVIFLAPPSAALAHAYLVKSIPAQRAVLYRAPAKIQLWFNERLEARYSSLTVTGPEGNTVALVKMAVGRDDPKLIAADIRPLAAGRYVVKYRVLSVDGHVVHDEFYFTVKQ
ncbi:MAG: copper resistance CopC family protein [Candidatus Binatia bacterium]